MAGPVPRTDLRGDDEFAWPLRAKLMMKPLSGVTVGGRTWTKTPEQILDTINRNQALTTNHSLIGASEMVVDYRINKCLGLAVRR